jgi:hypothetical protein
MNAHTAGPWKVRFQGPVAVIDADNGRIPWSGLASVITEVENEETGRRATDPEGVANARLIATAPEILEALRRLLGAAVISAATGKPFSANAPGIVAARYALEKATTP